MCLVLRSFQAAIRTVSMIVTQRLMFGSVRDGFSLVSTVNVAASTNARIQELTSMVLGEIRTRCCVARRPFFVKGRCQGGASSGVDSTGLRIILVARCVRVNFLSTRLDLRVTLCRAKVHDDLFYLYAANCGRNARYPRDWFSRCWAILDFVRRETAQGPARFF